MLRDLARVIADDFRHYCEVHRATGWLQKAALPLFAPAWVALAIHRCGRALRSAPRRGWLLPARAAYAAGHHVATRLTGLSLPSSVEVGERVWLGSGAPTIIAPNSRLGSGVRVHAGVTLGINGRGEQRGVPSIGADVTLCAGAAILGPIEIAAGAVIGPNSVVARSVGPGGWLGVPAARVDDAQALIPSIPGAVF